MIRDLPTVGIDCRVLEAIETLEKRVDILQRARMADAAHIKGLSERLASLETVVERRTRRRVVRR